MSLRPFLCLATLFAAGSVLADNAPTVSVTGGALRGKWRGSIAEFLGIPYAQPPVGALRWRPPQPVQPWTGVRDAVKAGPTAMQPDLGWNKFQRSTCSEDCLYLNVLAPRWPAEGRLPVIVYIHGGANIAGAGWDYLLENTTLPERGVVLASFNYRLGVFGFLAHPELTAESPDRASGNYAIQDQIAAIRWVRENIANFGGDPGNITVMGQSAGAEDIGLLLASPLTRGLFAKAIVESGPLSGAMNPSGVPDLAAAEQAGARLAEKIGSGGLAGLRALSADALLAGVEQAHYRAGPDVDGWVLREQPGKTFASGQADPVPLLTGCNARESTDQGSAEALPEAISRAYGPLASRALPLYGLGPGAPSVDDPVLGNAGDQFLTDLVFRCPVLLRASWQSAAGRPVWVYQFSRTPIGLESVGPAHSFELAYVFGDMNPNEHAPQGYNGDDRRISAQIQGYWVNFARTGNPNGPDLPAWPRYQAPADSYLEFTAAETRVEAGLRQPYLDLYRDRFEPRLTGGPE